MIEAGGLGNPPYKTILIIGVIHGDEPQGKFLIENYLENQVPQPPRPLGERAEFQNEARVSEIRVRGNSTNRLLFIPCLNPDGMALKTRQNANGVDLNRNFSTKNWGLSDPLRHCEEQSDAAIQEKNDPKNSDFFGGENSSSEIETRFVEEILEEFSPDLILTLHAPFKVVNYDGPASEVAQKISEIINYPVQSDIGYPTPGSFGTYAGVERNIPTITLELDEEVKVETLVEPINKIFDYLVSY